MGERPAVTIGERYEWPHFLYNFSFYKMECFFVDIDTHFKNVILNNFGWLAVHFVLFVLITYIIGYYCH